MPAHLTAQDGPLRGLVLNLEGKEEWLIGRDPDECDLVIEDGSVSRRHARIHHTSDGFYLKNLSRTNPCLVNEEKLSGRTLLLKENDILQIGNTSFLFSDPDQAKEPKGQEKKKATGYDDIFADIEMPQEEEDENTEADLSSEEITPADEEEFEQSPPLPPKPEMTAYDTIFEDTGIEEELPFHLISEMPLVLKVVAGPNAGAEIGLEKGKSYILGKDPNSCDIVFQDLSVSRNHASLKVDETGHITLQDLDSKNGTSVNGTLIQDQKSVTSQDLVAVGTTVFMIIDRDAPQETIYSPPPIAFEPSKQESEEEFELPSKKEKDWKRQPIPWKYLLIAGSSAAVFLILLLTFFSLFKPTSLEMVKKEPVSEIQEALAKFEDVQYSFNPGSGKLFLVGHVLTTVDYQEMKYRLDQIDFVQSVEDTVVIDEGVWKMMNDILSNHPAWRGVSIHSPKAGRFVVSGYLPTLQDGAALYEYLTVNFPYLDRLENHIIVEQTLNQQIQSILTEANLGGVSFQFSNGAVILSGNYSEKKEKEMKKTLKEINILKGVSSVKNFAVAMHPDKIGIDLSKDYEISGMSTYDGRGYSVVMNGKIYTLGDQVDGMKITSIETSTILLEKDGLKYKIDYTR